MVISLPTVKPTESQPHKQYSRHLLDLTLAMRTWQLATLQAQLEGQTLFTYN